MKSQLTDFNVKAATHIIKHTEDVSKWPLEIPLNDNLHILAATFK
jgi:hypothetical protein